MNPLIPGFGLILVAAVSGGAFAVPLKLLRKYEWENTWLLAWFITEIFIPPIVLGLFLPVWWSAVEAAGTATVLSAMAFGFLWGLGSLTFALGITAIGLSLGYATIMGIVVAVGSIIPMIRRWGTVPGEARSVILLGIVVCLMGVAVCGKAGMLREKSSEGAARPNSLGQVASKAFLIGLSWCILSGLLSACANLGFDFADRVAQEAQRLGAGPLAASMGRWITVFWGSFLAILIGTSYSMFKKGTWKNYIARGSARDFWFAALMGGLQFLAQIPYGMGAYFLGRLGTTVGWAVNIAFSLLVANAFGFITGEWEKAPKSSLRALYLGLCILVVATVILAYGNNLATR